MKRIAIVAALVAAGLAAAVPTVLTKANSSGLAAFARGDGESALRTFGHLARLGHRDGMNNLAILRLTGPREKRDLEGARALFERASARGHAVAGYNLARISETRHDTPMEEVARILALLDPLVTTGDPHAAAEMADTLYFRNREALVPDLPERRLALRRAAAEGGDPVYLYRLGRELWDRAGDLEDPDLAAEAVAVMERAARAGEPRAMLHMGSMEWQSPSWVKAALPGGFPGGDRFDWWARGAGAGNLASACRFAVNHFRAESRLDALPPVYSAPRPAPDARTGAALAHLDTCADAARARGVANPVFGAPALYLGRPVGGVSRERASRAAAKTILGVLLHEGRLLGRDPARARAYIAAAAPDNDRAAALLAELEGR